MFQPNAFQSDAFQTEEALLAFQLDAFQLDAFQTEEALLAIPEARRRRQTIYVRLPGARIRDPWELPEEEQEPVPLPPPRHHPPPPLRSRQARRQTTPMRALPLTSSQLARALREDEELLLLS